MSSTHKPQEAIAYAKSFIKAMPIEPVAPQILDDVNQIMWTAAPWRWTLGSMPAVTLVSSTQDYTVSVPADFLYLTEAYLTDGSGSLRDLRVEPTLPTAVTNTGQVSRVALVGTTLRTSPKPGTQPSSAPQIISLYKKKAPIITANNMSTAGVHLFDDEWFWVFKEGVLWKAYQWADDGRAGGVTIAANGQAQFSGQRANFESALAFMKQNEKLPNFKAE